MGSNPLLDDFLSDYPLVGDDLPVVMVSWNDVQDFLTELKRPHHRRDLPATNGSGMGECLPRRHAPPVFRATPRVRPISAITAGIARIPATLERLPGGEKPAEQLGSVRHVRQRLRMVPRLVRRLPRDPREKEPPRPAHG